MSTSYHWKNSWDRIEDIFLEVIELTEEERETRLAELTGDDDQLRDEIKSLIAFDTTNNLPSLVPSADLSYAPAQRSGNEISDYRLLFPLALNPNSEVWCAEHTLDDASYSSRENNAARVAIKFLRGSALDDERRVQRFHREAFLLAQLRHPQLAQLIDFGRTPRGTPFIVTHFVDGQSITEFADQQRLSLFERIELIVQVCDAVSYAHQFQIVHRDLKPANILVATDGQPVVIDFGISTVGSIDNDSSISEQLTKTGECPMTPAWAAPEQVHCEPTTAATDQYAIGLVLYQLMSGHHPYSDVAHPHQAKLLNRICDSSPRPLSEVVNSSAKGLGQDEHTPELIAAVRRCVPKELSRQLRGDLDRIVSKSLSKDPNERYETVSDFRSDLRNLLMGRATSASLNHGILRQAIRRAPLKTFAWTAMALAILATVVVAGISWLQVSNFKKHKTRHQSELRKTQQLAELEATRLREVIESQSTDALDMWLATSGFDPLQLKSVSSPAARAILARRAAEVGKFELAESMLKDIGDAKDLPAHAQLDVGSAWQFLGRPVAGLTAIANDTVRTVENEEIGELLSTERQWLRLRLLIDAGWLNEAKASLDRLEASKRLSDKLTVAELRLLIGWKEGAEDSLQAIAMSGRKGELSPYESAHFTMLQAQNCGDVDQLEQLLKLDAAQPFIFPLRGRVLLTLGDLNSDRGRLQLAEEYYQKVVSHFSSKSPNHFLALVAMAKIAQIAGDRGQRELAAKQRERLWQRIESVQEFATLNATWVAALRTQAEITNADAERLIRIVKESLPNLAEQPYIVRLLALKEFELAVEKGEVKRAYNVSSQLVDLESKLWGTESLEYTYALASKYWAETQSASDVEAPKLIVSNLRRLRETLPRQPALAFLDPPILNETDALPIFQWIRLYQKHRFNTKDVQEEMVDHTKRTLAKEFPKVAETLDKSIQELR